MTQFSLTVSLLCLLALQPLGALDVQQLKNHNCSAALNIPIQRRHQTMGTEAAPGESAECPPWFHRGSQGAGCEAGPQLGGIIWPNMETLQTYLLMCNCITQSNGTLAVGACLYTCNALTGYFPLPCDATDLNNFTCAGLNREGQLCGQCIEGHAPPVYSYDLRCVECKDYQYNWLKYLTVAFLPLTVFFCVVTVFSISFTSPLLSGVVLVFQVVASPVQITLFILIGESGYFIASKFIASKFLSVFVTSVAGIWNLDFFRLAYDPFCLHPNMTTLHALALDYAIVFYPLLLIMFTYAMVNLHDHHFKPVVWVWKPFKWLLKHIKQQWDVRTSLIDVFASFIFLSTSHLVTTSISLLVPTYVYFSHDKSATHPIKKYYLLSAPTVEYFGWEHLPFALLALTLLLLLVVLPMLLLFLYPLRCFQHLLNRLHLNSHALRTFMDVFQGTFKDGTNGTRDYRSFSGLFLLVELLLLIVFSWTFPTFYYPIASMVILVYCVLFIIFQPYKRKLHNNITIAMGIAFLWVNWPWGNTTKSLHGPQLSLIHQTASSDAAILYISDIVTGIALAIPTLYLLGLVTVLIGKRLPYRVLCQYCARLVRSRH